MKVKVILKCITIISKPQKTIFKTLYDIFSYKDEYINVLYKHRTYILTLFCIFLYQYNTHYIIY